MHVFGQHHPRDDFERVALFDGSHRSAQFINAFDKQREDRSARLTVKK
jgi:hypothetical protein